ncbi:MAG: thioredoxin domain-containing protein [Acidobacteria bacterium]|nr:thioredoxin domain-containing protein [Acidobacteriota bacterium]
MPSSHLVRSLVRLPLVFSILLVCECDSGQAANRLANETSPYLRMHANNPVDWFPWGEEAFEKARREDKPIFLSVGYSTCHWCHVMERESFSNPEVAALMNRHFVSIKVDREERPDIDRIYMSYVLLTTGSGGWPMSVFLTPDRAPFFGGSYFPLEESYGQPGFRTVLTRIAGAWDSDRPSIVESSEQATNMLRTLTMTGADTRGSVALDASVLDAVFAAFDNSYDSTYAGFGDTNKFPRPVAYNFLLRYWARTGNDTALRMSLETLRAMAKGGVHDHLGGGFHRYSTGRAWRVPHFEKMLYDQAQLTVSYVDAFQITGDPLFAETARDILDYVLRDMLGPEGGFYSAEDADSRYDAASPEHGEGAFYVWTAAEIERLLGATPVFPAGGDELEAQAAAVFSYRYGVEAGGNVPAAQDVQGELAGKNILYEAHSPSETARRFNSSENEVDSVLAAARSRLLAARGERPRPPLDDKMLTAWNGLMISALARAGQVLDEPSYTRAAGRAATFLQSRLYTAANGRLQRRYRLGDVAIDGFLSDYTFLIQGLLDLYEASFDTRWLEWAATLQEKQDEIFWSDEQHSYFTTGDGDSSLLYRRREDYDGAEPSPNSVAALNLLRLWQLFDRDEWRARADESIGSYADSFAQGPSGLPQLAVALDFAVSKPKQIVIAGNPAGADTRVLLRLVHERFIPNKILLLADGAENQAQLARWLPFVQTIHPIDGRATAYICENYVCNLPTSDPEIVARLLDGEPVTAFRR